MGRPKLEKEEQLRTNISINISRTTKLHRIGKGNVSAGVRIVTDAYDEKKMKK